MKTAILFLLMLAYAISGNHAVHSATVNNIAANAPSLKTTQLTGTQKNVDAGHLAQYAFTEDAQWICEEIEDNEEVDTDSFKKDKKPVNSDLAKSYVYPAFSHFLIAINHPYYRRQSYCPYIMQRALRI